MITPVLYMNYLIHIAIAKRYQGLKHVKNLAYIRHGNILYNNASNALT